MLSFSSLVFSYLHFIQLGCADLRRLSGLPGVWTGVWTQAGSEPKLSSLHHCLNWMVESKGSDPLPSVGRRLPRFGRDSFKGPVLFIFGESNQLIIWESKVGISSHPRGWGSVCSCWRKLGMPPGWSFVSCGWVLPREDFIFHMVGLLSSTVSF